MELDENASLPALAKALRAGELPLLEYLRRLEARFEALEPEVRAFLPEADRFARLRREAEELVDRYPDPAHRPSLFGIPLGVKDIFHVDGFPTQAGSKLPPETLAGKEATVVTRLRAAGCLILGKTMTTEFAYFAPGPTRNPHNPAHTPGGSSSGSAAAVAAGYCPLSLGSQTIGSVNRPAAFCGVVGFKPSRDRISLEGVIPLAPSLDHVGLFAASAGGVELAASEACERWTPVDEERRPVLGVPEGPYLDSAEREGRHHFRNSVQRLVGRGYQVKTLDALPDFAEIRRRHDLLVAAEAVQVHAAWFEAFGERYHAKTAELIERGMGATARQMKAAREGREALRRQLMSLMERYGVDLWVTPAAPGPAPAGLESTGDPVMNLPWTHSGLPSLTLPAGVNLDGLPLGLQFVARWQADEQLLAWARQLESDVVPTEWPDS